MIFGKKPEPRGTGDREGERGKVQRPATHEWSDEAYVLERTARETERKTRLPGRGGLKSVRNGSLAGFGRLE